MEDKIETIHGSLIQHGDHNDRIYVMRLDPAQISRLIPELDDMAQANGYGKIFAKIPAPVWDAFEAAGYVPEAVVPDFFYGNTEGLFIAKYFAAERQVVPEIKTLIRSIQQAPETELPATHRPLNQNYRIDACQLSDAAEMSDIYRQIFTSYPFPIQQPSFLEQMMRTGSLYYCIRLNGRIAALAAAEIDAAHQNVEMTDFATVSQWRGVGLARDLLTYLDQKTGKLGLKTAYTIARAASPGMNFVFKRCGYTYAGMLKNNSQISGQIQSMTVWYKHL